KGRASGSKTHYKGGPAMKIENGPKSQTDNTPDVPSPSQPANMDTSAAGKSAIAEHLAQEEKKNKEQRDQQSPTGIHKNQETRAQDKVAEAAAARPVKKEGQAAPMASSDSSGNEKKPRVDGDKAGGDKRGDGGGGGGGPPNGGDKPSPTIRDWTIQAIA